MLKTLDFFQDDDDKYSIHQSFAVHAHIGSVRTVHARGKYLASGGADDRIYVYDMKKRQEIQVVIRTRHNIILSRLNISFLFRFLIQNLVVIHAQCHGKSCAFHSRCHAFIFGKFRRIAGRNTNWLMDIGGLVESTAQHKVHKPHFDSSQW